MSLLQSNTYQQLLAQITRGSLTALQEMLTAAALAATRRHCSVPLLLSEPRTAEQLQQHPPDVHCLISLLILHIPFRPTAPDTRVWDLTRGRHWSAKYQLYLS